MECSRVHLLDLPDELLMIIFKKLEKFEILYSLLDINMRLDQIVFDPSIINTQITLMEQASPLKLISSLPDIVLDRFCFEILPKIHDKIKWLNLETLSMERILLTVNNYSNLRQLDIFIMNIETDMHLFTNKSLINTFQNQIVALSINGKEDAQLHGLEINRLGMIFLNMLIACHKLRHLKFYTSVPTGAGYISFGMQSSMFSCSTLVELHMNVYRFDDCLFLLDGRLNQLRTLFVTTFHILPLKRTIINKEELPNLQDFSLTCISETFVYDKVIVAHLQRMTNLEMLALYFVTSNCRRTFIDGNNLRKNITNHMPRLNQFIFNIRSIIHLTDLMYFPSNEDIHRTFTSFKDYQVISQVDYFSKWEYGQCHIYSCPYTLTHYDNVTNNFPGGLFNNVQKVELFDERPFEHEFFIRICQAFPFLKCITIHNLEAQNFKQEQQSDDYTQKCLVIEYSHLTKLHLLRVHDDYAEQFLFNTKTCLSNYIQLIVDYEQLKRVTQNFTRNATQNNSLKIKRLFLHSFLQLPKHYQNYFPHLE